MINGNELGISNKYTIKLPLVMYSALIHRQKVFFNFQRMRNSSLGIVMPYVVFQVYLPSSRPFQCEFRIKDNSSTKRRLIFTNGTKTVIKNQLHARIPSSLFRKSIWLNLSINVQEFFENCFPDSEFVSIDSISISS